MLFHINPILIGAAVIPAALLMRLIYKKDKLDREPPRMLLSLVLLGAISTAFALVVELGGAFVLQLLFEKDSTLYKVFDFFIVVAFAEEGGKYLVLKKRTWRSPQFNCQFDGAVYAVFVSLGFALWENIKYVTMYGISTALVRAVTAVPGHAAFGVFMGLFYGMAKRYDGAGEQDASRRCRRLAVIVPAIIHGFYDFCLSMDSAFFSVIFVPFILLLFFISYALVRRMAADDRYIAGPPTDLFDVWDPVLPSETDNRQDDLPPFDRRF